MYSAFGIDHGEFAKGLNPAKTLSMARVMTGAGRSSGGFGDARGAQYARARLGGNKLGAQKAVEMPGNRDPRGNSSYSPTSSGFKIMNHDKRPYKQVTSDTAQARLLRAKKEGS